MQYVKVTILRDESASIPAHIGAWELPVLEALYGEEKLEVGEKVTFESRPWPEDVKGEFARLGQLYGVTGSGDNAQTWVERVYGTGSAGIKALGAAIAEARKSAEKGSRRKKVAADLIGDAKVG